MNEEHLFPTVLWAQRKHFVLLRVQVKCLEVSGGGEQGGRTPLKERGQ